VALDHRAEYAAATVANLQRDVGDDLELTLVLLAGNTACCDVGLSLRSRVRGNPR
jgi:hypothetical protein